MSLSKTAKLNGFKSAKHLAECLGVHRSTLYKMFKNDREFFDKRLKQVCSTFDAVEK